MTMENTIENKRLAQLREAWIKNIIRINNVSQVEAESLYDKIKPHEKH